jgi:ABC-type uncharacterized transport system involved in gliding motility auxiliary subunit
MNKRTASGLSIVFILIIFVALNVIAGAVFRTARLDLTERHLYTLSAGTRAMLKKLGEPITLRLYFSERLAANYQSLSAYGIRVRDLLHELAQAAHGKLLLETIDPEPFSPEEEFAESYGLTGAQSDSGEKLFLGLVGTNLVDGMETIPFFSPEREEHLEYDVGALIHALSTPEKPKLGIISGLPLETGPGGFLAAMQGGGQPYVIYEQLKKSFDVQSLKDDVTVIAPEIGALLIAHPIGLKPQALYAIDQFAMRGGRLLVLVDPFSETASQGQGQGPSSSDLAPLLAAWGVKYDPTEVVLDRERALPVQYGAGAASEAVPYLAWLRLKGDDLERTDLIVSDIETIQLASAGHLEPIPGATTKFTPLLQTSLESSTVPSIVLQMGGDPPSLLAEFKSANKRFTIGARVTGPVKSAYPQGPPAPEKPEVETAEARAPQAPLPAQLKESKSPLNLILVADADFLEDRFWVSVQNFLGQRIAQPNAGNGYFLINAVDNLLGAQDLISLRSRARSERPFTVVQALERRARDQYRAEEDSLKGEIDETEQRLRGLQAGKKAGADALVDPTGKSAALSPEEAREVKRFQVQLAESRRKLREVQRSLRADVIALGDWVKLINIALVPILVAAIAILLAFLRRRRRYKAREAGAGG